MISADDTQKNNLIKNNDTGENILKIDVETDKKDAAESETVDRNSDTLVIDFSDAKEKENSSDSTVFLSRDELIAPTAPSNQAQHPYTGTQNPLSQVIGALSPSKILMFTLAFVTCATVILIMALFIVSYALRTPRNAKVNEITGNNPQNLESLVASVKPAVVLIRSYYSRNKVAEGTGFVISPKGYMVTAEHVIHRLSEVDVWFQDGKRRKAKLISSDKTHDVAILKLDNHGPFPYVTLANSDNVNSGMETVILGYPLGSDLGIEPTVTPGIVSALRNGGAQIQVSAAVNPGNSGGPLINKYTGEVIGVVIAKRLNAEGIAFAVPGKIVKRLQGYNKSISR